MPDGVEATLPYPEPERMMLSVALGAFVVVVEVATVVDDDDVVVV